MENNVTILTIPLCQHHGNYDSIWLGIPNIQRSISVGLQQPHGYIWEGNYQHENKDRGWPDFITSWYVANIFSKGLDKCVGKIDASPLLSRCSSAFVINKLPYELDNSMFVLNFLPNKQKDVDDLLLQLPPLEYIEKVVSLSKETRLFLDIPVLRVFLEKYQQVPSSLLKKIEEYEGWRSVLVHNS
jgi:hypothetical protein